MKSNILDKNHNSCQKELLFFKETANLIINELLVISYKLEEVNYDVYV